MLEYRRSLEHVEILSYPEMLKCRERMKAGDESARHALICSILRLVFDIVYRWKPRNFADALSEANIAAMRAVDDWDPEKGRLTTVVKTYVTNQLRRPDPIHNSVGIRIPISTERVAWKLLEQTLEETVSKKHKYRQQRKSEILLAVAALTAKSIDRRRPDGHLFYDVPLQQHNGKHEPCLADIEAILPKIECLDARTATRMYLGLSGPKADYLEIAMVLGTDMQQAKSLVKQGLSILKGQWISGKCAFCGKAFEYIVRGGPSRKYCCRACNIRADCVKRKKKGPRKYGPRKRRKRLEKSADET